MARRRKRHARNKARKQARRNARTKQSRKKQEHSSAGPLAKVPEPTLDQSSIDALAALVSHPLANEAARAAARDLEQKVGRLAPVPAAARVAGLLTCEALGANAYRLEGLLEVVLQHAQGDDELDGTYLQKLFTLLDTTGHSRLEDPAEDIFVSLIMNDGRHYRVFEGLYEGNTFYLQRFVDAVSSMPQEEPFNSLRRNVHALLTLSEAIADRSGIPRYASGEEYPRGDIPADIASSVDQLCERVQFTAAQLDEIGLSLNDIRPFLTTLRDWQRRNGGSRPRPELERTPLLQHEGTVYVLTPSCISPAIRRLIVSFCEHRNELDELQAAIAGSYSDLFCETALLGDLRDLPTRWNERNGVLISDCVAEVDPGRFIHFLFVVDDFRDAAKTGIAMPGSAMSAADDLLAQRINSTARQFCERSSFRKGISLIVTCGWGRGVACGTPSRPEPKWDVEFVSADHLVTLSRVQRMSPLMLFRLHDHISALRHANVELQNINGLLNLYGWAEECGRDLLPHDQIERDMVQGPAPLQVMITQNALYRVRAKVAQDHDTHIAVTPNGDAVRISRYTTHTYFADEAREPLYGSYDDVLQDRLKSVYKGAHLDVWLTVSVENSCDRSHLYTLWDAFCKWLPLVVPAVERHLPTTCAHGNLQWHINFPFHDPSVVPTPEPSATTDSLADQVVLNEDVRSSYLHARVPQAVYDQFHRVGNCAEKAILRALVRGTSEMLGCVLDDEAIVDQAVPGSDAKQFHSFAAQTFADYLSDRLPRKPVLLEEFDESLTRLGLAWRTGEPAGTAAITGRDDCTRFLSRAVDTLWEEIRTGMSSLDKQKTLQQLVLNIEALRREERVWERTARAILALYGNDKDTHRRMADQAFKRNATIINSRLLMEMALCECLNEGGAAPGQLDITRLLSKVSVLTQVGGWSDGIREGAIAAEVRVSALGIIQVDHAFHEGIIKPFGYEYAGRQQTRAAERYDDMFRESRGVPSTTHLFEPEFQHAWLAEFGFEIDEGRRYLDDLEDHGRKLERPAFVLHQSELCALRSVELSECAAKRILSELTLVARRRWDDPPDGFTMKDVVPWRYRRRLSAVYRPILQFGTCEDPRCLVAPSFIRDAFIYRIDRTYRAEFDESHFRSAEMRRWIGIRRHQTGHRFNQEVADELKKHGWRCEVEITPAAIGIDVGAKDYGDIDVLAWHDQKARVIAIECKDLMFAKTPGEIARQLREFRGKHGPRGSPDRLRRHLDRVKLLRENQTAVATLTGMRDAAVESALVFRHVVPVQFVDTKELRETRVEYLSTLGQL